MQWFWGRLKGGPAALLACPACSGFWIGLTLAVVLRPATSGTLWLDVLVNGFAGLYLTPVAEGVLLWGLATSEIPHE